MYYNLEKQFRDEDTGMVQSGTGENYHTLFDSVDEGFCIIKILFDENDQPVDYKFLEVNPAFEKQTGFIDPEGKKMRELAPNHEQHWFEMYGKVALEGEPVHFQQTSEALDGYYDVYAFPHGKPEEYKVAVLFNDITQKEYSNALLRAIVDNSEYPIISKDLNGIITSWNESAEQMFGYTAEKAVGRNIRLIIPEERQKEENEILEQLKQGKKIEHYETVRQHKDGSRLRVSLTISPIQNAEGEIIGACKIARNITERGESENKFKQAKETLEEHVDSRTSELQSYQQQLRFLASELNKAEEQERQRLAAELHNNLGQMLAVAKMKLKGLEISDLSDTKTEVVTDLSGVIDEALTYTQELMTELKPPPALDKKDIRKVLDWVVSEIEKYDLEVVIEDDKKPKPLDEEVRTAIYQCVRELLFNIVKYADVDEARLILRRTGDEIRVIVEDEGKGFNMKEKQPVPTDEGGFGLFKIRERMDWIGGRFEITSELGKGTKAILYAQVRDKKQIDLPEIPKEKEDSGRPPEEQDPQIELWNELDILIADDHQMVRNGFRRLIDKQHDLKVIGETSNGKETVKLARKKIPDVILMDVNMPEMDGIEATKIISSEIPEICIIGLSLHDRKEVVEDMVSAGACAYLSKDQAFETLCKTIRNEVKKKNFSD